MLQYAVYATIPVLIVFVVVYKYTQKQRILDAEAKKQDLGDKVITIRTNYKSSLKHFAQEEFISSAEVDKFYTLANNYFVFQSVSEESVTKLKALAESITQTLKSKKSHVLTADDLAEAKKQISDFLRQIPTSGSQFNGPFYEQRLPKVLQKWSQKQVSTHATQADKEPQTEAN